MTSARIAFAPNRWTTVTSLVVTDFEQGNTTNMERTKTIDPPMGGSVDVAYREGWLGYRVRNADTTIVEVGLLPAWRVVEAIFT